MANKTGFSFRSISWLLPFFGFVVGYYGSWHFFQKDDIEVPRIIGKSVQDSLQLLSTLRLGVRIISFRQSASRVEGVVLEQIPGPGRHVRPNQQIFVIISRNVDPVIMPNLCGKKYDAALAQATKLGLEVVRIPLTSIYQTDTCIAQEPLPGVELIRKKLTLYTSVGFRMLYTMPNFVGQKLDSVRHFLKDHHVGHELIHKQAIAQDHACSLCIVTDQSPVAGAIVDMMQSFTVHLVAEELPHV